MWIIITILTLVPTIFGALNNRASDLYWKKKVGTEAVDAVSVKEIDGFIWLYGLSSVEGYRNILIGKYDLEGQRIWVNGYGNKITTIARNENVGIFLDTSFAYTSDGGWVVCGLTIKPENTNANEKWIARVLPNGDFAWSFRVSDSDTAQGDMLVSCGEISTGFILLSDSGRCGSLPKSLFKCLLATHFDFDGNLIKSIAHGDTRNSYRGQAVMTGNGVIAGHHEIAKLDENGDYEFGYALKIGGVSFESVRVYLGVHCELSDSSIVSAGTIWCGGGGQNYYIQRMKPWDSGAIDWAWRIGNCDEQSGRFFCSELSDNTTLIQITTMTTPYVKNIRFSRNGTILETFSSPGFISGVKFTEDNHTQFLAAFPTLHKYSHVEQETYIWKFDREEGFICVDDKDILMNSSYSFNNAFEDVTATVNRTTITHLWDDMTSYKTAIDLRLSQTKYENSEKIVDKFVCYKHKLWCHGFTRVDTANVCAGHGECIANNNCSCYENYWPPNNCSQFECYKIRSESPKVCNYRNGTCSSLNNCTCHGEYYGNECEKWDCAGIYYNDSTTKPCSSHGVCTRPNNCECAENYKASLTCDWKCGEYLSGEPGACSKHGSCVGYNNCSCVAGYRGDECQIWSCFGIYVNDHTKVGENICGGIKYGTCHSLDNCHCRPGYSSSIDGGVCDQWFCGEYFKNDTDVCNKRGNCTANYFCDCEKGYDGPLCDQFMCGSYPHYVDDGCGNHGSCVLSHKCNCTSGYWGDLCTEWECFSRHWNESEKVCGGKGKCVSDQTCVCHTGYSGPNCDLWYCGGIMKNDTEVVCSGRSQGECTAPNECSCEKGYYGDSCESFDCFSVSSLREDDVCSGNGDCKRPDFCVCETGYADDDCSTNTYLTTVMTPVLATTGTAVIVSIIVLVILVFCCIFVITFCLVFCVVCCVCCCVSCCACCVFCCFGTVSIRQFGKLKKFGRLRNIDLLLEEQAAEDDDSIAHISISKELFEIDIKEIKVDSILGEGGSNSVVYRATWKAQTVAFKCFKTRMICSSQDKFDEFEKEVSILSSVSHPNVVRFFGCSLNPPRVGIVMEFCGNGEILMFFLKYNHENKKPYPLEDKIRCLKEIASAMEYLHSRNIIHRDLKPENVLMDQNEACKIMDFGVSKLARDTSGKQTKRVGTSFYMAPEVVIEGVYDGKCDVYSFGVMTFVLLTEKEDPYEGVTTENFNIEMRAATDPNFRPDLDKLDEIVKTRSGLSWIKTLVEKCWKHDPQYRPSFQELIELFKVEHQKSVAFVGVENNWEKVQGQVKEVEVENEEKVEVVSSEEEEEKKKDSSSSSEEEEGENIANSSSEEKSSDNDSD